MLRNLLSISREISKSLVKQQQQLVRVQKYCLATSPTLSTEDPFGNARVAKIANNNADLEKKLRVLMLEADVFRQEGKRAPDPATLSDDKWEHLLGLASRSARMKYYSFLWQVEKREENRQAKKEERREANKERLAIVREQLNAEPHIAYGMSHVTMFLRIYDQTIDHWNNNKLIRAMQFSPKIVIDCSYGSFMTPQEASNAAKQFMLCFAENRTDDDPFDLHFCNADMDTHSMKVLHKFIPKMHDPSFPMNVHEGNVTDVFPRDKLVYLTPHCRSDLVTYNPDDIYIIGGMVDKANNEALSLAKAKRQGLRMARFPLDRYLQWKGGSGKSLTINQTLRIMLDLKRTNNDWKSALTVVPKRKIVTDPEELQQLNKAKSIKRLRNLKFTKY